MWAINLFSPPICLLTLHKWCGVLLKALTVMNCHCLCLLWCRILKNTYLNRFFPPLLSQVPSSYSLHWWGQGIGECNTHTYIHTKTTSLHNSQNGEKIFCCCPMSWYSVLTVLEDRLCLTSLQLHVQVHNIWWCSLSPYAYSNDCILGWWLDNRGTKHITSWPIPGILAELYHFTTPNIFLILLEITKGHLSIIILVTIIH